MGRLIEFQKAKNTDLCSLCHQRFIDHFQPPPDADKDLAANWCPAIYRPGFTSICFRKESHDTEV
jgi:hypothetical protein